MSSAKNEWELAVTQQNWHHPTRFQLARAPECTPDSDRLIVVSTKKRSSPSILSLSHMTADIEGLLKRRNVLTFQTFRLLDRTFALEWLAVFCNTSTGRCLWARRRGGNVGSIRLVAR